MTIYHACLGFAYFYGTKAPGLNDRKSVHVTNIDRFTSVQPRELSRCKNAHNQSERSVYFSAHIWRWFLLIFLSFFGRGICVSPAYPGDHPWLTGPLFTPSGEVIGFGHFDIEPYFFLTTRTGRYDKNWHAVSIRKFHQLNAQVTIKAGIHERITFSCLPQYFHNETQKVSTSGFGDLPIGFDIQLLEEKDGRPPVKLIIQETIPIGRYHKLKAVNKGTDAIGLGSFSTQVGLASCKLFHFKDDHYLSTSANFFVVYFAPVHVRGINVYGGDDSTNGTVYPGTSFNFYCSAEYTLTENWVLALDVLSYFSLKGHFKGFSEKAVSSPSTAQISLAPAIEYNWSKTVGVIAGPWFTVGGKNSTCFYSAVAAVNFYF